MINNKFTPNNEAAQLIHIVHFGNNDLFFVCYDNYFYGLKIAESDSLKKTVLKTWSQIIKILNTKNIITV